jgi:PII-like signaling protein
MESSPIAGRGLRVRAYFGEHDKYQGHPLWRAFLEVLRTNGAAGATVTRGIAGFGAGSVIHAASWADIVEELPLVLEWVDTEERVRQLVPTLEAMLPGGLITTDPVEIVRYQAGSAQR